MSVGTLDHSKSVFAVNLTSRISPRSPWAASAACMKLAPTPKLLSVATVFAPTSPLLPTPQTMTFPPAFCDLTMHSTALKSPSRALGSVWYNLVMFERAVAWTDKMFVALSRILVPSGSWIVVGGVTVADMRMRLQGLGDSMVSIARRSRGEDGMCIYEVEGKQVTGIRK